MVNKSAGTDLQFEMFWKNYPKKIDKSRAYTAWLCALRGRVATKTRLAQEPATGSEILIGLAQYLFSEDSQYIPYPATWLNGRRWENVDNLSQRTTQPSPKSRSTWREKYDSWKTVTENGTRPEDWRPPHARSAPTIQGELLGDD